MQISFSLESLKHFFVFFFNVPSKPSILLLSFRKIISGDKNRLLNKSFVFPSSLLVSCVHVLFCITSAKTVCILWSFHFLDLSVWSFVFSKWRIKLLISFCYLGFVLWFSVSLPGLILCFLLLFPLSCSSVKAGALRPLSCLSPVRMGRSGTPGWSAGRRCRFPWERAAHCLPLVPWCPSLLEHVTWDVAWGAGSRASRHHPASPVLVFLVFLTYIPLPGPRLLSSSMRF